jgi:O-antigen/teichoic acid export membrane protein
VQGILFVLLSLISPVDQPALAAGIAYSVGLLLSLGLNPLPKAAPGAYRVNAWMLLAMVSNQVLSSADVFLVAALASLTDAGIYAAIYRLPNAWLALLVMARSALLPLATQARHGGQAAFLHVRRLSLRWSSAAGILLAGLSPLALWAVPTLLGRSYEAGRMPAVVLLLATAVATAAAPLHHLFLAFDEDRTYALCLLITAIVNVLVNLALIPSLEMIGAAIATLAANVFLGASLYWAVHRRLPTLSAADGAGRAP